MPAVIFSVRIRQAGPDPHKIRKQLPRQRPATAGDPLCVRESRSLRRVGKGFAICGPIRKMEKAHISQRTDPLKETLARPGSDEHFTLKEGSPDETPNDPHCYDPCLCDFGLFMADVMRLAERR